MQEILKVDKIVGKYQAANGEITAIDDLSFTVQQGEFISVVGPSGCGKSTLLSILSGLLTPTHGTVTLAGKPVDGINPNVGYMLQRDNLLDWRTIYKNVLLGLEIQHQLDKESVAYAEELLKTYGLWEFRDKYPAQLSGGMRQRAALLRTYLFSQNVALLDEPFSALDTITKGAIHTWYLEVMERIRLSTLFITHDIDEAILLSDRIYILSGKPGRIVAELAIREPKPRSAQFPLTGEFLQYKREIIRLLELPH